MDYILHFSSTDPDAKKTFKKALAYGLRKIKADGQTQMEMALEQIIETMEFEEQDFF